MTPSSDATDSSSDEGDDEVSALTDEEMFQLPCEHEMIWLEIMTHVRKALIQVRLSLQEELTYILKLKIPIKNCF